MSPHLQPGFLFGCWLGHFHPLGLFYLPAVLFLVFLQFPLHRNQFLKETLLYQAP
jgi:hypothetical protein